MKATLKQCLKGMVLLLQNAVAKCAYLISMVITVALVGFSAVGIRGLYSLFVDGHPADEYPSWVFYSGYVVLFVLAFALIASVVKGFPNAIGKLVDLGNQYDELRQKEKTINSAREKLRERGGYKDQ